MPIFGCKCRCPHNSPQFPNVPRRPNSPLSPTSQDPDDPDAPVPEPPRHDPALPYMAIAGCFMLLQALIGVYVLHMPLYPELEEKGPPPYECKCTCPGDIVPDIPYDGSHPAL